jgi:four helix bundle protein
MTPEQMKERKKRFAIRIIRLVEALPKRGIGGHIGGQLLPAGTSVGSNYRAACRARSQAEFIAKLGIVEEEADESLYWMELLIAAGLIPEKRLSPLMQEADEILSIVVSSITTARGGTRGRRKRKSAVRNPQSAIKARRPADRREHHG